MVHGVHRLIQRHTEPPGGDKIVSNGLRCLPGDPVREWRPLSAHGVEEASPFQERQRDLMLRLFAVDVGKFQGSGNAASLVGSCRHQRP
jgi:hypothetical protein